jgi:hypothetical protein
MQVPPHRAGQLHLPGLHCVQAEAPQRPHPGSRGLPVGHGYFPNRRPSPGPPPAPTEAQGNGRRHPGRHSGRWRRSLSRRGRAPSQKPPKTTPAPELRKLHVGAKPLAAEAAAAAPTFRYPWARFLLTKENLRARALGRPAQAKRPYPVQDHRVDLAAHTAPASSTLTSGPARRRTRIGRSSTSRIPCECFDGEQTPASIGSCASCTCAGGTAPAKPCRRP